MFSKKNENNKSVTNKENDTDFMSVDWQLIDICNYKCPYCKETTQNIHSIYTRNRLLNIAWKILNYPASLYKITFSGGEPTLHPGLPDIVEYFCSVNRVIHLRIKTNVSQQFEYYDNLAKMLPNGTLWLEIHVHPAYACLSNILLTIATVTERGQYVKIRLAHDTGHQQNLEILLKGLNKLRASLPFEMDIFPVPTAMQHADQQFADAMQWRQSAIQNIGGISESRSMIRQFAECDKIPATSTELLTNPDIHKYETPAIINIAANGVIFSAPCEPKSEPLWKMNMETFLGMGKIIPCSARKCSMHAICRLPAFTDKNTAQEKAEKERIKRNCREWIMPLLRNPLRTGPTVEDEIIYFAQKENVNPMNGLTSQASPISVREALKIYEKLKNSGDKHNFLKCIVSTFRLESVAGTAIATQAEPGESVIMYGGDEKLKRLITAQIHENGQLISIDKFINEHSVVDLYNMLRKERVACMRLIIADKSDDQVPLKAIISDFLPEIEMIWTGSLALPLWISQNYPIYINNFIFDATNKQYNASILQEDIPKYSLKHNTETYISIIILANINMSDIFITLDTIMLQHDFDFEIIIDDREVDIDTQQIIDIYGKILNIRFVILSKVMRYNSALDAATGKYVIFMRQGDLLKRDFIKQVKNSLYQNPDTEIIWFTHEEGDYSGVEAIDKFIGAWLHHPSAIYGRDLLLRSRAKFETANIGVTYLSILRAFYLAQTILSRREDEYIVRNNKNHLFIVTEVMDIIDKTYEFYKLHDLKLKYDFYKSIITYVWNDIHDEFLSIKENEKNSFYASRLPKNNIREFTIKAMLEYIASNINSSIGIVELDRYSIEKEVICEPLGKADSPAKQNPILSVIMPNYNKEQYLHKTIASILDQNGIDFELIIIDDASSDKSRAIIELYAAIYPQIRLYSMRHNVRQGICRNIGLQKARGEYVIFVDSDDLCAPEFFSNAIKIASETQADIAIFSSISLNEHGEIIWRNILSDATCNSKDALQKLFLGEIEPASWAKIYRKKFLIKNALTFPEYIYYQDVPFFYNAIKKTDNIVLREYVAYYHIESSDSVTIPLNITQLHIQSSIKFIIFMQNCLNEWKDNKHIIGDNPEKILYRHMNNIFYKYYSAFVNITGELPIEDKDIIALCKLPYFCTNIMKQYADISPETEYVADKTHPVQISQASNPLVTIIVNCEPYTSMDETLNSITSQILTECELRFQSRNYRDRGDEQTFQAYQFVPTPYICFLDNTILAENDFLLHAVAMLENDPELAYICFSTNHNCPADRRHIFDKHIILNEFSSGELSAKNPIVIRVSALNPKWTKQELLYHLFMDSYKGCVTHGYYTVKDQQIKVGADVEDAMERLNSIYKEIDLITVLIESGQCDEYDEYLIQRKNYIKNVILRNLLSQITECMT